MRAHWKIFGVVGLVAVAAALIFVPMIGNDDDPYNGQDAVPDVSQLTNNLKATPTPTPTTTAIPGIPKEEADALAETICRTVASGLPKEQMLQIFDNSLHQPRNDSVRLIKLAVNFKCPELTYKVDAW